MKTAIFPLTGDPMHYGHLAIIEKASKLCDKLYVALGINPEKAGKHLFTEEERVRLTRNAVEYLGLKNVEVESFSGWLADYARQKNVSLLVRGARNEKDMKYETMAAEYHAKHGIETVLIPTYGNASLISSTRLKEEVRQGKLVHEHTTPRIKQALEGKLLGISIVGVTGQMGSGKSTFCRELADYANQQGIKMQHIDCDALTHSLYCSENPVYPEIYTEIKSCFGKEICAGNSINRKTLSKKALASNENRLRLMQILSKPFQAEIEKQLANSKGIVLLDAAYLDMMLPWVNYNAIIIKCDEEERKRRVLARDKISEEAFERISRFLLSPKKFRELLEKEQKEKCNGAYYEVDSVKKDYKEALGWIQKNFPMF